MKQLALISYAITALGIVLLAFAVVAGLSPLWQLSGAMLVIAGGVKIAVVQIWQRLAGL
jgi:predicted branched-subunit amino acid permease